MKPTASVNMPSAAISTVGIFFGHDGVLETIAARDDARIRRRRADVVAGGRLAIFGEIGFEQIALRFRLALERAQLDVLLVRRRRLLLELVEAGAERLAAASPATLASFSNATREPLGLAADLPLEIGDLRAQLLDARMLVQQRRRLLGKLRPQRHLLLGQPAHQLGIR